MPPRPITPGFITSTVAETLNETLAQVQSFQNRRDIHPDPGSIVPPMEFFPAKLTAYDADSGYYTWIEQAYNGTAGGSRYDKPSGRYGNPDGNPASAMAGVGPITVDADNPVQCFMVEKGFTTYGTLEYEIVSLAFVGSLITRTFVEKVCPTVTRSSGVVTNVSFSIQHGTYRMFAEQIYDSTCNEGDTDCCPNPPYVTVACCPDVQFPTKLCLTVTSQREICDCADGIKIVMDYYSPQPIDDPAIGSLLYGAMFGAGWPNPGVEGSYVWLGQFPSICANSAENMWVWLTCNVNSSTWEFGIFGYTNFGEDTQNGSGTNTTSLNPLVVTCSPLLMTGELSSNQVWIHFTAPPEYKYVPCDGADEGLDPKPWAFSITEWVDGECDSPIPPGGCESCVPCAGYGETWESGSFGIPLSCLTPGGGILDEDCLFGQEGGTAFWSLFHDVTGWTLYYAPGPYTWTMADEDFNCSGPNTFIGGMSLPDVTIYRP